MSMRYLHLIRMDVAHDHEAAFNEVYDKEQTAHELHISLPTLYRRIKDLSITL